MKKEEMKWSYRRPGSEHWYAHECDTREEAILEAFQSDDEEELEVFQYYPEMPKLWTFDVEEFAEEWSEHNHNELPEDYGADLYEPFSSHIKPELKKELEEAIKPHWEAMEKALHEWLIKHVGPSYQSCNEETVTLEDYENLKAAHDAELINDLLENLPEVDEEGAQ